MKINWGKIDVRELGALVCSKLRGKGIDAIVVGGACCTIYSENKYKSSDIDFVSYESIKNLTPVLAELGFERKGSRYFRRDDCQFFIEFVSPPPAIGSEPVKKQKTIKTRFGNLVLLTPTDCVKDRLAGYYFWNDPQSLEQALLIADAQKVDFKDIKRWSIKEGFEEKYRLFLDRFKKLQI